MALKDSIYHIASSLDQHGPSDDDNPWHKMLLLRKWELEYLPHFDQGCWCSSRLDYALMFRDWEPLSWLIERAPQQDLEGGHTSYT